MFGVVFRLRSGDREFKIRLLIIHPGTLDRQLADSGFLLLFG
jgi:hypothetical protein